MSVSSEFGRDMGLIHEVVVTGRKVGADRNFWLTLAHDQKKFRQIVELINAKPKFDIVIDYSRSLAEMIKVGKYDWVDRDITAEHFPIKGKGRQEKVVTLFHFDKTMTSEEVITEMDKEGFLPAKIEGSLALGESQPELQKQFPIIALGSAWRDADGAPLVSCLRWGGARRILDLRWFGNSWHPRCRFLAVCK